MRLTIAAAAVLLVLIVPSAAQAAYCDTLPAWIAAGPTTTVSAGQSIQAAVNRTPAGGTVSLLDGNYGKQRVTIKKAIRLKAQNKYGARLQGTKPRSANDGRATGTAINVTGAGAMIDGLDIRYYSQGIVGDNVGPVNIRNNRLVSHEDAAISIYDARAPRVECNDIRDPYLANDVAAQTPTQTGGVSDAQSDYGVAVYGATRPIVNNNYFFGIFNQSLSFKEGSTNPTANRNTFEGSRLTALFFGQNRPHNGPYEYARLPTGFDRGVLTAVRNVFRQVRDARGVYYLRSPIRVRHVQASAGSILRGNVVESGAQGLFMECNQSTGDAGCTSRTVRLEDNTVGGAVMVGSIRYQVNTTACILTGPTASAVAIDTRCISVPVVRSGPNTVTQTGTVSASAPVSTLRTGPAPVFEPDLSY